jgi:hypothetical protein
LSRSLYFLPLLLCGATLRCPSAQVGGPREEKKSGGACEGVMTLTGQEKCPRVQWQCNAVTPTSLTRVDKTLFRTRNSVLERVTWCNWRYGITCVYSVFAPAVACLLMISIIQASWRGWSMYRVEFVTWKLLSDGSRGHGLFAFHREMLNISWLLEGQSPENYNMNFRFGGTCCLHL